MFRSSALSKTSSKRERARALPWAMLLQSVVVVTRHWRALSEKDRARLTALLRDSGGRLDKLSERERAELRKLAGKLDLRGLGRELTGLARGGRARRRRGASA